jgi:hypothetical protein
MFYHVRSSVLNGNGSGERNTVGKTSRCHRVSNGSKCDQQVLL